MRNYTSFLLTHVDLFWPDASTQFAATALADVDEESLSQQSREFEAEQVASFPGMTFVYTEVKKCYWLMDRDSLGNVIRFMANTVWNEAFGEPFNAINPIPFGKRTYAVQFEDSPRDSGWTGVDGERRAPPPSEKKGGKGGGVSFQIDFFTNILLLYQELVEAFQLGFSPAGALASQLLVFIRLLAAGKGLTSAQDAEFQTVLDNIKKTLKIPG